MLLLAFSTAPSAQVVQGNAPSVQEATAEVKPGIPFALNEAVVCALENNFAFSIERLQPSLRSLTEEQERAAFDPGVSAGLTHSRGRTRVDVGNQSADNITQDYSTTGSVGIEQFFPSGTTVGVGVDQTFDGSDTVYEGDSTEIGIPGHGYERLAAGPAYTHGATLLQDSSGNYTNRVVYTRDAVGSTIERYRFWYTPPAE